jgi:hypothetical protein
MKNLQTGEKAEKRLIPDRKNDKTTDTEAEIQSEKTNMNKKKGYNEIQQDAPVNPDEKTKKQAKTKA